MIEPKIFEVPGRTDVRVVLREDRAGFLVTVEMKHDDAWCLTQLSISSKSLRHAENHLVPMLIQRAAELDAEDAIVDSDDADVPKCASCDSPKIRPVCTRCGRPYCDPCFAKTGLSEDAPCPLCVRIAGDNGEKGCAGCRPSYDVLEERYRAAKRELAIRSMQEIVRIAAPVFFSDGSGSSGLMNDIGELASTLASKFGGAAPDPVAEEAKDNLILSTEMLLKYGRHSDSCRQVEIDSAAPCTCGWAEIEKHLRPAAPPAPAPPAAPAAE